MGTDIFPAGSPQLCLPYICCICCIFSIHYYEHWTATDESL